MSQKSDRLAAARAALEAAEADGPEEFVTTDAPPTGVRSPATSEIDNNALSTELEQVEGTAVPALVRAPSAQPVTVRRRRVARTDVEGNLVEHVDEIVPNVPASVHTRGPLVPLVPLSEVHPSTVEAAISDQRIPNDQIHAVFEDADGVKRDALGHVFTPDPTPRVVPPTAGIGFE